jgi:hypothetical protein
MLVFFLYEKDKLWKKLAKNCRAIATAGISSRTIIRALRGAIPTGVIFLISTPYPEVASSHISIMF